MADWVGLVKNTTTTLTETQQLLLLHSTVASRKGDREIQCTQGLGPLSGSRAKLQVFCIKINSMKMQFSNYLSAILYH